MKRLWVLGIAFFLVFSMFGVASAASYYFSDTIDDWGGEGIWGRAPIPNAPETFDYQHNINDDVDFANGDLVTEAWLVLDFDWDFWDVNGSYTMKCGYTIAWDYREFAYIQFDESGDWEYVDEVDNSLEYLTVGIDWLNDDGYLDVSLNVNNSLGNATAWLDSSKLCGFAESGPVAPIPEPTTFILMSVGIAGFAVRERKRIFRR